MKALVGLVLLLLLFVLSIQSLYQWFLAVVAFGRRASSTKLPNRITKFIVLIPAHNEENSLPETLSSLANINYPADLIQAVVVADHCQDKTAGIATANGAMCLERFEGQGGKGAALAWAIEELHSRKIVYDAAVIVDADTLADPELLNAFNQGLLEGHAVQQGYNYLSNPWESPFTCIIAVTSILKNGLFYTGKSRLGLSGMLTGTGMCLAREVIERYGWTAFSVGEDWEFSVSLLLGGEIIAFNRKARVLAKESYGMKEASRQRLRWASGRHAVTTNSAAQLFLQGIRKRNVRLMEAATALVAPNYSTQASLSLLACAAAWFLAGDTTWGWLFQWSILLLASLSAYFMLGVLLTDSPWRTLAGLPLIPFFLPWRLAIEVLGLLGYGRGHWGHSARAVASDHKTTHR